MTENFFDFEIETAEKKSDNLGWRDSFDTDSKRFWFLTEEMMVAQNAVIAALSSTALISLAPNVLLVLFPKYASGEGETSHFLVLGQALAAGGLLGDVFLHTIAHAEESDDVGLWILLGFTIFLVADMIMRSLGSTHDHHEKAASNEAESEQNHLSEYKTSTVMLNLAADSLHNFTDGLAIGASFSIASSDHSSVLSLLQSRGGLATLSILFHEIPHELGDFAILVRSGFSRNQAILAQFGTAIAAMLGTVAGLTLTGFAGESLIFITADGFIYLAAVTILPEILEEKTSLRFRVAQLMCFGAGISFLYAVSFLEEMGGHGGHSHGHHHHGHREIHDHHDHIDDHHEHHAHEHHAHDVHAHDVHAHASHHHGHEHHEF